MTFLFKIITYLPALPYFASLKYTQNITMKEYNIFVFNDIGICMAEVLKAESY